MDIQGRKKIMTNREKTSTPKPKKGTVVLDKSLEKGKYKVPAKKTKK